jgi:hypothetical protein
MAATIEQRRLAAARQARDSHVAGCEICGLAVRERPGADFCVLGARLNLAVVALVGAPPAKRRLSISEDGVVDED